MTMDAHDRELLVRIDERVAELTRKVDAHLRQHSKGGNGETRRWLTIGIGVGGVLAGGGSTALSRLLGG